MNELKDRLITAREQKGISQTALAKAVGASQSTIAALETGRNQSTTHIAKLAAFLDVSPIWLETGKGEMKSSTPYIPPAGGIAVLEDTDTNMTHREILMCEVRLSAGAGNTEWIIRESDDPLVFREGWFRAKHLNPEDLRGMYVKGDSMSPVLNNWDTVIIDTSDTELVDGEIYAVVFKEKFYIKAVKNVADGIDLISFNSAYDVIEVRSETARQFQCLGRMVWRGG